MAIACEASVANSTSKDASGIGISFAGSFAGRVRFILLKLFLFLGDLCFPVFVNDDFLVRILLTLVVLSINALMATNG